VCINIGAPTLSDTTVAAKMILKFFDVAELQHPHLSSCPLVEVESNLDYGNIVKNCT
jgi:hypothetical protein